MNGYFNWNDDMNMGWQVYKWAKTSNVMSFNNKKRQAELIAMVQPQATGCDQLRKETQKRGNHAKAYIYSQKGYNSSPFCCCHHSLELCNFLTWAWSVPAHFSFQPERMYFCNTAHCWNTTSLLILSILTAHYCLLLKCMRTRITRCNKNN